MIFHDITDCLGEMSGSVFLASWVSLEVTELERIIFFKFAQCSYYGAGIVLSSL